MKMSNYPLFIPAHSIIGKLIIGFCCYLPLALIGEEYLCTADIGVITTNSKGFSSTQINTDDEYVVINKQRNLKAEIKTRASNNWVNTHLVDSEKGYKMGPEFQGGCVTDEGMDKEENFFSVLRCNAGRNFRDVPVISSIYIDKTDLTFVFHYSEPFISQTSHGTCERTG